MDRATEFIRSDPQSQLSSAISELAGVPAMTHHADLAGVGVIQDTGGAPARVFLQIVRRPEILPVGIALILTPAPEQARALAANLIAAAATVEAHAAAAAAEALARAKEARP